MGVMQLRGGGGRRRSRGAAGASLVAGAQHGPGRDQVRGARSARVNVHAHRPGRGVRHVMREERPRVVASDLRLIARAGPACARAWLSAKMGRARLFSGAW